MEQILLKIDGMVCTSCELIIENELNQLNGIKYLKAIYSKSRVDIVFDPDIIKLEKIKEVIEKLDYKVKETLIKAKDDIGLKQSEQHTKTVSKDNKMKIGKCIGIGIIILAIYLIIQNTVGFNTIPQVGESMGYGILFVVGLLTSLHCISMCGGINLSVCVHYKVDDSVESRISKLKPSALYNLGRVLSYTVIGGIVGTLGSVVSFSGGAKGIIAMFSGLFMLIMGLNMLNIFPWLKNISPRLPKAFGRNVHNKAGSKGPFLIGILNGFMPCGPLQAMQLYALGTGSFVTGALSMFVFSLGTIPLMFGFGAISSLLSSKFTHKMMKVSAVLVMILGIIMFNRGMSLSGFNFIQSITGSLSSSKVVIAQVENDVQFIDTDLKAGSYTPIVVQKGIPVVWKINVEKGTLNGCNNPISIPKYNIQKELVLGENYIEFTPEEIGDIVYTCWMGMISSTIKIVEDITTVSIDDIFNKDSSNINCVVSPRFAERNIPVDKIGFGEIRDGVQYISFIVDEDGFSPAVLVMQKGIETKFVINAEELIDCNESIVFPEYSAIFDLEYGENLIEFIPEDDFSFLCWMGELNGYIKVVDDIKEVNIEELKDEVKKFIPYAPPDSGGGASCH